MALAYMAADRTNERLVNRQLRRAITASAIGSIIEWYDFLLYATVAGLYLGKLFFPSSNLFLSTLAAYSTYLVGFAVRPVGALVFGHFGDRIGRKATLIATLGLMGAATFLIGLTPTYGQIGIWGGIILIVLRLMQGIAVGGEWGGAVLLAVEWAPRRWRGLAGAFAQIGIPAGFALGFTALQLSTAWLGQASYWGWRLPFLASIVLLAVGLYVRLGVFETPVFAKVLEERKVERAPSITVLRKEPGTVILTALAKSGQFGPDVLFTIFVIFYLTAVVKVPQSTALLYATIANCASIGTTLFFGYLSDRVGRKILYLIGGAAMAVFGVPYFLLLNTRVPVLIVGAMILAAIVNDCMNGPQPAFFAEAFTSRMRYSGVSLGFQLAAVTAGGPAPLIATAILSNHLGSVPIGIMITIYALMGFVATMLMRERFREDFSHEYDEVRTGAVVPRAVTTLPIR
jgi:MFS family permease